MWENDLYIHVNAIAYFTPTLQFVQLREFNLINYT